MVQFVMVIGDQPPLYVQDAENDELFISMVDDTTAREVEIPAVFMLGRNG